MVRRSDGADTVYCARGGQELQLGLGAQLAEFEGRYDGWVDAGIGLDVEFVHWVCLLPRSRPLISGEES